MAAQQKERSAKTAAKRKARGEEELRMHAMADLFNSTGRQVQPGLSFALLDACYAAHESTFC